MIMYSVCILLTSSANQIDFFLIKNLVFSCKESFKSIPFGLPKKAIRLIFIPHAHMHVLQLHLIRKCSSDVKHVHSCISKKLTYILWYLEFT